MKLSLPAAALLAILPALALPAATPLLDFENETDLAVLRWASQGLSRLERDDRFATAGRFALRFTSPTWKTDLPEWPAFELAPAVTNWADYDRLSVDITNPGGERPLFALFISDGKVPFREGLHHVFQLPARGFRRFAIPLSDFPKAVNRGGIAIVHFFTERPKADLELHLDHLVLLKKGETLPDPPAPFLSRAARLQLDEVSATEAALARMLKADGTPAVRSLFTALEGQLQLLRADLESPNPTLARLEQSAESLAAFPQKTARAASIGRWHQACIRAGRPDPLMLAGLATSMEKLLPRELPVEVRAEGPIEISLARNEKESFQVAVMAPAQPLKNVSVKISNLASATGQLLRREQIRCEVVGYVQTKARPPYGSSHIGWWPDPILGFMQSADLVPGDLQAFWVRVHALKDQPPGLYQGTVTVAADGVKPQQFDLRVRVRAFTLPVHSPLPLAITFSPEDNALDATRARQEEWRKSPDYPVNAWRKHKLRWAEMLADYYISYDSLYHHGMPDFEVLTHLHRQGRLGPFNLGYYGQVGTQPGDEEKWKTNTLPHLRQAYARARELGLLDHAYIYGCDEATTDLFPGVQQAAALLKAEFPQALISTTTYDQSYGQDSVIKSMDWFCPLTPSFDPGKAVKARAAGRQVWWYICCGPHHPHANMFIEYPAIEGRLLMGAMTTRQRPDGFLYYEIH